MHASYLMDGRMHCFYVCLNVHALAEVSQSKLDVHWPDEHGTLLKTKFHEIKPLRSTTVCLPFKIIVLRKNINVGRDKQNGKKTIFATDFDCLFQFVNFYVVSSYTVVSKVLVFVIEKQSKHRCLFYSDIILGFVFFSQLQITRQYFSELCALERTMANTHTARPEQTTENLWKLSSPSSCALFDSKMELSHLVIQELANHSPPVYLPRKGHQPGDPLKHGVDFPVCMLTPIVPATYAEGKKVTEIFTFGKQIKYSVTNVYFSSHLIPISLIMWNELIALQIIGIIFVHLLIRILFLDASDNKV